MSSALISFNLIVLMIFVGTHVGTVEALSAASVESSKEQHQEEELPQMAAWSRGYPLVLREDCNNGGGNKFRSSSGSSPQPAAGVLWYFNESSMRLHMAAAPTNCLEFNGMNQPPSVGVCENPLGLYGHLYTYFWNSTVGSYQANGTNQCLGYYNDGGDSRCGALIFDNCTLFNSSSSASLPLFERHPVTSNVLREKKQHHQTIIQLRTPKGFCLGSPRRFTEGATLQSDQWKVTFGVNGGGCSGGNNFTYLQSLQVWQPTMKQWSINILHSAADTRYSHVSTSSITSIVSRQEQTVPTSSVEEYEEEEKLPREVKLARKALPINMQKEMRKWSHARGGYFTKKTPTEIVIQDIQIGDEALETWTVGIVPSSSSSTLSWTIDRTYLSTVKQESSRFQTINLMHGWLTVGQSGYKEQAQFASTLDTTFQWNKTSVSGYYFYTGCNDTYNYDLCDGRQGVAPWVYSNSLHKNHWMSLSPADLCIPWSKSVSTTSAGNTTTSSAAIFNESSIGYTMQFSHNSGLGSMAFGLMTTPDGNMNQETSYQIIPEGSQVTTVFNLTIMGDDSASSGGNSSSSSTHDACKAVHQLSFSTGNTTRDENTKALARVFHMWAGNMLGNSPTSSSCIFESSMYALMASVFDPPMPPPPPRESEKSTTTPSSNHFPDHLTRVGPKDRQHPQMPDLFEALRFEYGFFLETLVNNTDGSLDSVWDILGVYGTAYGSTMWQQQTSMLYGIYVYATTTGDKEFMSYYWQDKSSHDSKRSDTYSSSEKAAASTPVTKMGPLRQILTFLLVELGLQEDGLMHCLGSTGDPHPKASCNWLDIVGFGHHDAIVNSEAAIVLQGYADVALWLGDNHTAEVLTQIWKKSVDTYNTRLWNESLGLYADWIGMNGETHSFGYIWQQGNAANMASGIVGRNATRLTQMCNAVDTLYDRLYRVNNVTKERVFATPTNFIGVPMLYQVAWDQTPLEYENGALFTVQVQYEMQLRHMCNQSSRAIELYDKIVVEQFGESRCWGQHYQWSPDMGPPGWAGGDVLTDTTMIIVGLLRQGFKIRPTLTKGLIIDGEGPGPAYEGWTWTFWNMGERLTATVKDGKTVITKAT